MWHLNQNILFSYLLLHSNIFALKVLYVSFFFVVGILCTDVLLLCVFSSSISRNMTLAGWSQPWWCIYTMEISKYPPGLELMFYWSSGYHLDNVNFAGSTLKCHVYSCYVIKELPKSRTSSPSLWKLLSESEEKLLMSVVNYRSLHHFTVVNINGNINQHSCEKCPHSLIASVGWL